MSEIMWSTTYSNEQYRMRRNIFCFKSITMGASWAMFPLWIETMNDQDNSYKDNI